MGLYTEETYKIYGPQWRENLFYSHVLSMPLFLPFAPGLVRQFNKLARSEQGVVGKLPAWATGFSVPSQLAYLALNVLTQYACIRGVNLLAAVSSALTVVIVLNVRKLASLLLSIWLFGNQLSPGTLFGAIVVFGAAGMYSLGGKAKDGKAQERVTGGSKKLS
jgi:solute carrier family 35 (UDP-xylose/UDP-N-acetylglucosamine transporter), member B4